MLIIVKDPLDWIDKLIADFIWNDKKAKIKRVSLIGDYSQGGIKLPDFISQVKALKYSWYKRLLHSEEGDSILRDIQESWFQQTDVIVKRGSIIEDIFETLNSKDLDQYADIIVHVGTNDVANATDIANISSSIEKLITLVMVKAPTTKLHISAISPRKTHMTAVTEANIILRDLVKSLDCSFLNVNPKCVYQNGSVDNTILYDGLHLSHKGTKLLVECFVEGVESLNLTNEFVQHRSSNLKKQNKKQQRRKNQHRSDNIETRKFRPRNSSSAYYQQSMRESRQSQACKNCGLSNHNSAECYHENPIRCRTCGRFGHKDRFCKHNKHKSNNNNYYQKFNNHYDDSYGNEHLYSQYQENFYSEN
ncbi:uncharacterized protein LOC117110664 [Anneissia japonica]|uniref:uncharacterized protein LOC117110664 n=1 Tax=Anneissia japonica TaxID=1529436 RepID=UPI0014254DB6|nr:uncharacterized protein LOC117110664 [Anneissia japonica]